MGKKTNPITKFQKQCQTYFSSVSARACKYLYLNLPGYEDCLVISNADPDMLMTYTSLPMVSIHCIKPKDDFLKTFKELFSLEAIQDQCYLIRTEFITKAFKDSRIETVLTQIDPLTKNLYILGGGQEITIQFNNEDDDDDEPGEDDTGKSLSELETLMVDDGWDSEIKRAMFTASNIAGLPFKDPFIINELCSALEDLLDDIKKVESQSLKTISFDQIFLLENEKYYSNWYLSPMFNGIDLKTDVSKAEYKPQRLLLVDGLDMPCAREFLKKQVLKDEFIGTFRFYIYNATGDTVKCLACYDAPDVTIFSTRPYLETVMVSKKTNHREITEEVSHG